MSLGVSLGVGAVLVALFAAAMHASIGAAWAGAIMGTTALFAFVMAWRKM